MADTYIAPATELHAHMLAPNMREADVCEIWDAEGVGPLRGLLRAYRASSHCWVTMRFGSVQCMFGLIPASIVSSSAAIWMLGSDAIHEDWRGFLRCNVSILPELMSPYSHLFNYVSAENVATVSWLQWMGAEFQEAAPYGWHGRPFRRFDIRR